MTKPEFIVRPIDEARERAGLRQCFIELQDHEQAIYPEVSKGEAIVVVYLEWMFERAAHHGGAVFACVADALAGFATVLARVGRTDADDPQPEHAMMRLDVVAKNAGAAACTNVLAFRSGT